MAHLDDNKATRMAACHCAILQANLTGAPPGQAVSQATDLAAKAPGPEEVRPGPAPSPVSQAEMVPLAPTNRKRVSTM